MSESENLPRDDSAPSDGDGAAVAERVPLPRWKKLLLVAAGVFVAVGVLLIPFEGGGKDAGSGDLSTSSEQSSAGGEEGDTPPGLVSQFNAGSGREGGEQAGSEDGSAGGTVAGAAESGDPDLSPVFLKLGFSFFVGFAVGYAFRAFVKLALIFVGLQLLALFLLSYIEWVTVNWDTMANAWDGFAGHIGEELQTFKSFLTGSLPQASLATTGLYAGFRKN